MSGDSSTQATLLKKECEAFQAALEKMTLGEIDDALQEEAIREHGDTCPSCALFSKALVAMGSSVPDANEDSIQKAVDSIEATFISKRRRRRRIVAAAGTAALAASVLIALGILSTRIHDEKPRQELSLATGRAFLSESLMAPKEIVGQGDEIHTEDDAALFTIPNGVKIALGADSVVAIQRLEDARISMELIHGLLAVSVPPGKGMNLSVTTEEGDAIVTGTIFGMERNEGTVALHVLGGTVQAKPHGAPNIDHFATAAGMTFDYTTQTKEHTPSSVTNQISALLKGVWLAAEEDRPAPGSSDSSAEKLPASRKAPLEAEEATAQKSAKPPRAKSRSKKVAEQPARLNALYKKARKCRAEKDWECARESYETILNGYGDEPAAASAKVLLAEILLGHLEEPEEAARLFKDYQDKEDHGVLKEEAAYGECRALEATEDTAAEREALRRYLAAFPSSMNSGAAASRLEALEEILQTIDPK